jgi:hypothetical protein
MRIDHSLWITGLLYAKTANLFDRQLDSLERRITEGNLPAVLLAARAKSRSRGH